MNLISYDCWVKLYWKKQLEGNLTQREEKELQKLEKENLKTIQEVYDSLKNNSQIQSQIQKIKSHPWVKVIGK
jgi:hypothetical protein